MKVKKLLAILLSILILVSFSSCDTLAKPAAQSALEKVSSAPASEIQALSSSANSEPQAGGLTSANSEPQATRLDAAVKKLKIDKTVEKYEISHSSALIAIIRREDNGSGYSFSLLDVSANKETPNIPAVEVGSLIQNPRWSFDDKYLSVDTGIGKVPTTYLINSSSQKVIAKIDNSGMVWAPDSENAAFCIVNYKIKPSVDAEEGLHGTTDLTIHNVDRLKYKRILKGTANIMYSLEKWDKSGLYVTKATLIPEKSELIKLNQDDIF